MAQKNKRSKRVAPAAPPVPWRIRLEPYPVDLVFVTCRYLAADIASEEFQEDELDVDTCAGITYSWGTQILMGVFTDSDEDHLCTLHHECIHAALHTLALVGIDARSNNGECLTYLSENIFRQLKDKVWQP